MVYIRCKYGISDREITKSRHIWSIYTRLWPTLHVYVGLAQAWMKTHTHTHARTHTPVDNYACHTHTHTQIHTRFIPWLPMPTRSSYPPPNVLCHSRTLVFIAAHAEPIKLSSSQRFMSQPHACFHGYTC